MNCLVTGGCGFLGTYAVRVLLRHEALVVTYDLAPRQNVISRVLNPEELERVRIVAGDINDVTHLFGVITDNRIDTIVHLAALLVDESAANPTRAIQVNCLGLNHVFEAARIFQLRRVVWASSAGVLGGAEMYDCEWIPDQVPLYPRSVYGACKALNEHMACHYFENMGVDNIGLRFPIVYGPGRLRGVGAFGSMMIESAALGQSYTVPYAGDTMLNWLHVDDASQSIFLASTVKGTETRVFNVSGDVRSVKDAIRCVQHIVPKAKLYLGEGYIGFAQKYDHEGIERQLGYRPRLRIEEGFRESLDYFRREASKGLGDGGIQTK